MKFNHFFFFLLILIVSCTDPNNFKGINDSDSYGKLIAYLPIKECNERAGKNLTDGINCAEEIGSKINDILECENLNYEWLAPWASGPVGPMLHARVPCM